MRVDGLRHGMEGRERLEQCIWNMSDFTTVIANTPPIPTPVQHLDKRTIDNIKRGISSKTIFKYMAATTDPKCDIHKMFFL